MRSFRPILLVTTLLLAASCALLTRTHRPPRAPKSEAAKVKFPRGEPRERVELAGVWLRAVTMALDDYLPEEDAERGRGEGEEAACLSRRESWNVHAFVWSPRGPSDAGGGEDGGEPDFAGGSSSEPGMPKAPPVVYVVISLLPDACDFGDSPSVDLGAIYAIDTVNWRILASR